MKEHYLKSIRPANLCGAAALLLAALIPSVTQAADAIWDNTATVTDPPQIDATNFVNSGLIEIFTSLPFETSDTRNYTNSGTMIGSPGWFFYNSPPANGQRRPADNFVNLNDGLVQALDGSGFFTIGTVVGGASASSSPSYLVVAASNIVNKGTLSVGGNGLLNLRGTNVNVARSALEVTTLQPVGSIIIGQTNYINDVGIDDVWWGQTNGLTFDSSSVWNGSIATAPPHFVQQGIGGGAGRVSFSIVPDIVTGYSNTIAFTGLTLTNSDGSLTNILVPTNIVKQAVFVGLSDPSIMSAAVTFFPSSTFTNPFRTVCVELSMASTNVITQQPDQTSLFFYDTLGSETNRGLMVNARGTGVVPFVAQRPANYDLSRIDDGRFASGTPGNVVPDRNFLFDPLTYTNAIVVAEYAGYNAKINNIAAEPPPVTPGTVTNFPGRVQVTAENLDLHNARIRGEGEVTIKANHLLSSVGASVDCENLSYNLGSTNGLLNITGLSKLSVLRLKGNLIAWSAVWSNQATLIFTNNFVVTNTVDTNGVVTGTNAVSSPITNTVSINLYAMVLDAANLGGPVPVITWDLIMRSTNAVINDSLRVVESFFVNGESLTVNGTLALSSTTLQNTFGQGVTTALNNWFFTNAPNLLHLTNNGTLTVSDEAHFGDDRPIPYTDFVNKGTLSSGSIDVKSTYIENGGSINANVGPMNLVGESGKFQGGSGFSGGDLNLTFTELKFLNQSLSLSGTLNFNVTGALSDAGTGSGNTFTVGNGFDLLVKPNTGDLLGSTIQDAPPNFVEVDHVWAAQDRGASVAGYSDNAAIGRLILTVQNSDPLRAPLFSFSGTNGQRALYVDQLDISSLGANYTNIIQIDPSLTIYYASVKVGFTPPAGPAGTPQEPEEFLNGQFGGHLVWVSGFAGPNSSTAVIVNGQTVLMNNALRNSKIIDSDNDGIPNFFDATPLGGSGGGTATTGVLLGSGLAKPTNSLQVFSLNFNAAANTAYRVEVSTNLANPSWQLVTSYTNFSPATANVTIADTNNVSGRQRFYRVRVAP
jgi:hypothetical protein